MKIFWLWLLSTKFHCTIVGQSPESFKSAADNVCINKTGQSKGKTKDLQTGHCGVRLPIIETRKVSKYCATKKRREKDVFSKVIFLHSLQASTIEVSCQTI